MRTYQIRKGSKVFEFNATEVAAEVVSHIVNKPKARLKFVEFNLLPYGLKGIIRAAVKQDMRDELNMSEEDIETHSFNALSVLEEEFTEIRNRLNRQP